MDGNPVIPPSKSLIRFRLVCKAWKSMIDDPDLVHLHLKRFPVNASDSRVVVKESNCRKKDARWLVRRSDTLWKTLELELPAVLHNSNSDEFWLPAGTVDGLFLFYSNIGFRRKGPIILWNPSIRKTLLIPDPPSITKEGGFHELSDFDLCLGFDPSTNDHKVLLIVYPDTTQPIPPSSVDIFSVKDRS